MVAKSQSIKVFASCAFSVNESEQTTSQSTPHGIHIRERRQTVNSEGITLGAESDADDPTITIFGRRKPHPPLGRFSSN